ncbi:MAG: cupin domain-containing protein [Boseongicola sp.]
MISQPTIVQIDDVEWESTDENPGLRYKFLIDADHTPSHGFSMGVLEVAPGTILPPHTHAPQEIYLFHAGRGRVLLGDETHDVAPGTVVYVPENCRHGLENLGDEALGFTWIFPTDTWAEIAYVFG